MVLLLLHRNLRGLFRFQLVLWVFSLRNVIPSRAFVARIPLERLFPRICLVCCSLCPSFPLCQRCGCISQIPRGSPVSRMSFLPLYISFFGKGSRGWDPCAQLSLLAHTHRSNPDSQNSFPHYPHFAPKFPFSLVVLYQEEGLGHRRKIPVFCVQ